MNWFLAISSLVDVDVDVVDVDDVEVRLLFGEGFIRGGTKIILVIFGLDWNRVLVLAELPKLGVGNNAILKGWLVKKQVCQGITEDTEIWKPRNYIYF